MITGRGMLGIRRGSIALVALLGPLAGIAIVGSAGASAPPSVSVSPAGSFSSGQTVSVTVGPNNFFTPHARVNILECADPGGSVANLPKDITSCDGDTIEGNSILVADDGSFSDSAYPVYAVPNSALGEQPDDQPTCNQTNPCVLYVGQDQNDFTAPKVFSTPFLVTPGSGVTTASGGQTGSSGSSGTTNTTVAPAPSAASSSGAAVTLGTTTVGATGSLADTGPSAELTWLAVTGTALVVAGAVGRRRALRRIP
jgi:hypothetical protein